MDLPVSSLCKDLSERAFRTGKPYASAFLSAGALASERLRNPCVLFGGIPEPERVRFVALPEPSFAVREEDYVAALRVEVNDRGRYSHRDYLGSALALGVSRESVGDICVGEGFADLIATPAVACFLAEHLQSVSRTGCRCRLISLAEIVVPERECSEATFSVSSARLDCMLSAVFGVSRNEAKSLVEKGFCQVNRVSAEKPERLLVPGDAVALRGYGRFRLLEQKGLSRKGKLYFRAICEGKTRLQGAERGYK